MKKTRYIYFNKKNGSITDILSIRKRGNHSYIESDNETVIPFISGKKCLNDVIIAYDKNDKIFKLYEKDNIIRLGYYGSKQYKIPMKKMKQYDLNIIVYPTGNILEVSIDPTRISDLYSTKFKDEIKFAEGTEIRIFIKNKNGSKLLNTIVIDAQNLLDHMQLFFNIGDIDINDISFYTNRIFNLYNWYVGKTRFISPFKDKIKFEVQKAHYKRKRTDFNYHLEIKDFGDKLVIKNNIEDVDLVKIEDYVIFFIVDKHNHEMLHDKFYIYKSDLSRKEITIKIDMIPNKGLLYNHRYISVLLERGN